MDTSSKTNRVITGACGEHYVAGYLSGLGLIVAMPRAGIPGCDLLVAASKSGRAVRVQVKTGRQSTRKDRELGKIYLWQAAKTVAGRKDANLWYAFVWLKGWPNNDELPEVFFVPSKVVVKCMDQLIRDEEWLCFWMVAKEAQKYDGKSGIKPLLAALR